MISKIFASLFIVLMMVAFLTAGQPRIIKIVLPLYLFCGAGWLISIIWSMP